MVTLCKLEYGILTHSVLFCFDILTLESLNCRKEADMLHPDIVMMLADVFECISSETGSTGTIREKMLDLERLTPENNVNGIAPVASPNGIGNSPKPCPV